MTQRTALIIAVGLTTFVLVVGGGLAAQAAQPAAPMATAIVATPDTTVFTDIQNREAEYQARLDQANSQLQDAYAQQQALQAQLDRAAASSTTPPTITDKDAVRLALLAAPGATLLRNPELVNLQGVSAYEVALNKGLVYVDAATGKILYNGAAPQTAVLPRNHGHSEHNGQEHQGGDD